MLGDESCNFQRKFQFYITADKITKRLTAFCNTKWGFNNKQAACFSVMQSKEVIPLMKRKEVVFQLLVCLKNISCTDSHSRLLSRDFMARIENKLFIIYIGRADLNTLWIFISHFKYFHLMKFSVCFCNLVIDCTAECKVFFRLSSSLKIECVISSSWLCYAFISQWITVNVDYNRALQGIINSVIGGQEELDFYGHLLWLQTACGSIVVPDMRSPSCLSIRLKYI